MFTCKLVLNLPQQDARRALDANNHELKKRRIAVTLADPRVRARHTSDTGLGRQAEARNRSVRVRNVPAGTQEALLQQAFEKVSLVRRVELFGDKNEAVVELETPAVSIQSLRDALTNVLIIVAGSRQIAFETRAHCL